MYEPAPRIKIEDVKTEEDAEAYLNWASEDYHNDPSNPSSCRMYEEHYGRACPCEVSSSQITDHINTCHKTLLELQA